VAERGSPRIVTQRRFEDPVELSPSGAGPGPDVPLPVTVSPPLAPVDRSPSDLALRARQLNWARERERYGSKKHPTPEPEGPK